MRFGLLWLSIITGVICLSAKNYVTPEKTPLSGHGSDTLLFSIREHLDNRIRQEVPASSLFLRNPSNIRDSIVYDPVTKNYVVMSLIGNKYHYNRPYTLSVKELMDLRNQLTLYGYNRQKEQELQQNDFKNLVSDIQFLDKLFTPVFGKDYIKFKVQGSVDLTLGMKVNKVDNPTLPVDMRKTTHLDFDEKMQFNINGGIGDLVNLDWSYNTEATFDFENVLKLNYQGKEDNIIRKIEAGNVSLPLTGTLISGVQNLWGFRTDLQFGKLAVSGIFSQQKGEAKVIRLERGAQRQEFEISAHNYEANKHFFLARYFRDNYDAALRNLPVINSGVRITRIEVWVTNKNSHFEQSRNIVAFTGLGENQVGDPDRPLFNSALFSANPGKTFPDNGSNTLYEKMNQQYAVIRDIGQATAVLSKTIQPGKDFEKLENARLLDPSDYVLNEQLGYLSLNTALNADEVLAVAYEYTVRGEIYTVGELTYNAPAAPQTLIVKMLKGTAFSPEQPTWDLMMKNVYNMGAYSLSPEEFTLEVLYQNDKAGTKVNYLPAGDINAKILLSVMNLDQLNEQSDAVPDGRFDYIEGVTVLSGKGRIVFPVLEPFGSWLENKINNPAVARQYVFQELYDKTQSAAEQYAEKNKFFLKGSYQSSSSSEISLGGGDIPRGSVKVSAGGVELLENIDYTVNYTLGTVSIINSSLLESGTPITIKSENRSDFGLQTQTLVGAHLDYQFNENFNIGATLLHMNEKPLTHKVNLGEEPLSNTIWGLNATYNTESQFITTLLNKLPFIHTQAKSHLTIDAEFAKFMSGTAKGAGGNAYLDDFEGSKISLDMKGVSQWKLASTPRDNYNNWFPEGTSDSLNYGYHRAKLAWYVVDPLFYRMSTATPAHIRADREQRSNHFVREIRQTELFPNKDLAVNEVNIVSALTVAYYPREKGPYNFDAEVDREGKLRNPEKRWGGMMRSIATTDFESANVQYIEMWLMDPFVYEPQHAGGHVCFDLGSISEDILRDGRKSCESGLPVAAGAGNTDTTVWGIVPSVQTMTDGFDNNAGARRLQDVGLDGMNDEQERIFYAKYLERLMTDFGSDSKVYRDAWNDPAGDNYHYFRGSDYDAAALPVLERYKKYNGTEGNSPTADMSPESYPTAATNMQDVEDINGDNTLNETESFFRYDLELKPEKMKVGDNFITDITTAQVELPNGETQEIKWYQIKIPVSAPSFTHNSPDLKSVRFMRMFLRGFRDSVILRLATLDLVRDNWRKYEGPLDGELALSDQTTFDVSTVNLEENASRTPVNYVMPPGIDRAVDAVNTQYRELNEQALSLKVVGLKKGESRGVYKTFGKNLLKYKMLKMDVHAEALKDYPLANDDLTVFIRLGNDNVNNYYEYEVPLKLTAPGFYASEEIGREAVWPAANRIELSLGWLQTLKLKRNAEVRNSGGEIDYAEVFELPVSELDGNASSDKMPHRVKVKGKPTLADVRNVVIGIRNATLDEHSAEVWVNELRVSEFDNQGGWAANARITAKLADVATVSFAGSRMTPGFGSIEQHASEIEREDFRSIDFSTTVEVGKFFPEEWRLRIPFYYSYSRQSILPEYDPTDTDITLETALNDAANKQQRDSIRRNAEDYMMRKSINLTNVGIESKDGKPHLLSFANLSLTYSYNKSFSRNVNTEMDLEKNYRGLISYIYHGQPQLVEPFKKSKALDSKHLKLIKDFNFYYLPSMLSITSDITRDYREIKSRNLDNPNLLIIPTYEKDFMWTRDYAFKFNLTKNLVVDFHATARARIDEPEGIVDKQRDPERYQQWKDTVWNNILDGGRPVNYNHDFSVQYALPLNKLPFLDWTRVQTAYSTRYDWQAAALTKDSTQLGNVIRNASSFQVNADLLLTALYHKSEYIRGVSRPQVHAGRSIVRFLVGLATSLKHVNIAYSEDKGTTLPGFLPEARWLGQQSFNGSSAPGFKFLFGAQKPEFGIEAARKGWITTDSAQTNPFLMNASRSIYVRAALEPMKKLRINLTSNWSRSRNSSEYLIYDGSSFVSENKMYAGNFSMSVIAIKSAFYTVGNNTGASRGIYQDFLEKRKEVSRNLARKRYGDQYAKGDIPLRNAKGQPTGFYQGYGPVSQDVLIGAFTETYGGGSYEGLIPKVWAMRPNWRVTYTGLMDWEPMKKIFSSFTLNHTYTCKYNIGSFTSNLKYAEEAIDAQGNWMAMFDVNTVSVNEQFNPLISMDMVWVNNLTTHWDINRRRDISLSLVNAQLAETASHEMVVGVGYRFGNMPLFWKNKRLDNDINLQFDYSVRKNNTVIRRISEAVDQLTAGQKVVSLKVSADYTFNNRLNLRLFYDRVVNTPYISLSFPTTNTNFGLSVRYTLMQ